MENICKKCGEEMEERSHRFLTNKLINQPYFFTKWYVCPGCHNVQHFEKYKIFNKLK